MPKILIVDDMTMWGKNIEKILHGEGRVFRFAPSLDAARSILASDEFELVITNMILEQNSPLLEGLEVLELVKKNHNTTQCIVVSEIRNFDLALQLLNDYRDIVHAIVPKSEPWVNYKELLEKYNSAIAEVAMRRQGIALEEQPKLDPIPESFPESIKENPMTNSITWLHVSDLHFRRTEYPADVVLEDMLTDIKAQMLTNHLKPDFIVVSGDVAFSGLPKEYQRAAGFFRRLLTVAELPLGRIFMIPGNHDVHWKSIDKTAAAGYVATLNALDEIDRVLGSAAEMRRILRKFRYYRKFLREFYTDRSINETSLYCVENISIAGRNVCLVGLNTVWMSGCNWKPGKELVETDDRHNLVLGRRQLREAIAEAKGKSPDLVIAVMHHPTEWLKDHLDRPHIEGLLVRDCDFVLQGHMHTNQIVDESAPDGKTIRIMAGASFQRRSKRDDYNGYNFVQFDPNTGMGTVHMRSYSPYRGGFWTSDNFSYPNMPEGRYEFKLPVSVRT